MERIEDEVLRDLGFSAAAESRLIGAVADALEDSFAGEAEFLEQIAAESGWVKGILGGLGSLWGGFKQSLGLGPPTLRSPVLPYVPPPQLTAGVPVVQAPPPTSVPASQQQQPAEWLTGGFVPRPPSSDTEPPTLRSPTFPSQPTKPGSDKQSFDAFEAVLEAALQEDALDAAAPVLAGVALKRGMPHVAALPSPLRRHMVAAVANAMRTLGHRSAPQNVRAIPGLLRFLSRAMAQRGLPLRALPQAIPRQAARLANRPDLIAKFAAARPPSRGQT
jgi:hypothetical protein